MRDVLLDPRTQLTISLRIRQKNKSFILVARWYLWKYQRYCCDALNLQSLATTVNLASSNFLYERENWDVNSQYALRAFVHLILQPYVWDVRLHLFNYQSNGVVGVVRARHNVSSLAESYLQLTERNLSVLALRVLQMDASIRLEDSRSLDSGAIIQR